VGGRFIVGGSRRGIGKRDDWDQVGGGKAIGRGYGTVYHDAGHLSHLIVTLFRTSHIATRSRAQAVPYKTCAAPPLNWKRNRCTRTDGSIQGNSLQRHRSPKAEGEVHSDLSASNKIRLHFFFSGESGVRHRKSHPRGESGRARIGCPVYSGTRFLGGSENGESNISITNRPVHFHPTNWPDRSNRKPFPAPHPHPQILRPGDSM
jgi:hypothetical protein